MSLLPRLSGGYENDLVEAEATGYFAGGDEVAVMNRIKDATHDAEPVTLVRLDPALPGQPCSARWRGHALAVRAAPADRPGDQQEDQEDAERQNSKGPRRNRQLAVCLGLEERQSQGHTRRSEGGR